MPSTLLAIGGLCPMLGSQPQVEMSDVPKATIYCFLRAGAQLELVLAEPASPLLRSPIVRLFGAPWGHALKGCICQTNCIY